MVNLYVPNWHSKEPILCQLRGLPVLYICNAVFFLQLALILMTTIIIHI